MATTEINYLQPVVLPQHFVVSINFLRFFMGRIIFLKLRRPFPLENQFKTIIDKK